MGPKRTTTAQRTYLLLVLPTLVVLFVVTLGPFVYGIWLSLHHLMYAGRGKTIFVGMDNYIRLFSSQEFWYALRITIVFSVSSTLITVSAGLLMAFGLNRNFRGRGIYMSLFVLPAFVTPIVSGIVWKFMLDSQLGVVGYFMGVLGLPQVAWLSSSQTALLAVILVDAWQWTPFTALLFTAGLQVIPRDYYEAATLDGAGKLRAAIYVTIPQLLSVLLILVLIRIMDTFKVFDIIYVMTEGGPGRATEVFNMRGYYIGFKYFQYGQGAALGIISLLLVIFMCFPFLNRWIKMGR